MSRMSKFVMAGALAISTVLPMSVAESMPVSGSPLGQEVTTDITQAAWCGRYRCERRRPRLRVYVEPRIIIRPAPRYIVREPRYIVRERPSYSRHVRWCLNKFSTYDPSIDMFINYDGVYRPCRSPYR